MSYLAGLTWESAFDFQTFIICAVFGMALALWTLRVSYSWLTRRSLLVPERRALETNLRQLGYVGLFCAGAATLWAWIDPDGPLVRVLSRAGIFWFSVAMVPYWIVLERAARQVDREIG